MVFHWDGSSADPCCERWGWLLQCLGLLDPDAQTTPIQALYMPDGRQSGSAGSGLPWVLLHCYHQNIELQDAVHSCLGLGFKASKVENISGKSHNNLICELTPLYGTFGIIPISSIYNSGPKNVRNPGYTTSVKHLQVYQWFISSLAPYHTCLFRWIGWEAVTPILIFYKYQI